MTESARVPEWFRRDHPSKHAGKADPATGVTDLEVWGYPVCGRDEHNLAVNREDGVIVGTDMRAAS